MTTGATSNRDVLVVGDVNLDVLVAPVRPFEPGTDVPAAIRLAPGGAGANVALGLARLGRSTTLVGCIGADDSAVLTRHLQTAGVELSLRVLSDARTGTIVAVVDSDGERSMAADRGANSFLSEAQLGDAVIENHRHLHVSGYSMLDPRTGHVARAAIARAKRLGRSVSVDPASVGPLLGYGAARFRTDITGVDLLLPNSAEARGLTGVVDIEQAARELALLCAAVAVTCGADGALWADSDGVLRCPAVAEPGTVRDTTGAGDAFTAGLLNAWLAGQAPTGCLMAGQRAAARVVTGWGAQ